MVVGSCVKAGNTKMKEVCPVCSNTNLIPTICRENLVTMQNYVYCYADEARHAKVGKFVLMICPQCGFSYNASFNNNLLQYNENYDNSVPSQISETYYREVASFLYKNFPIEHGLVIDIGCGKGSFLKILCEKYPTVKGVGIDPSYELSTENSSQPNENISFIQDFFKKEQINQRPSLIICRHVIEHIYYPVDFMTKVYLALSAFRDIPIFVEVPDLEWILNQNAFWDFCYEHCNYFTVDSFNNIMELSGFAVEKTYKAFNRQYIWLKAITKSAIPLNFNQWKNTITNDIVEKLQSYAKTEKILVDKMRYKLQSLSDKRQATSDKLIYCRVGNGNQRCYFLKFS